MIRILSEHIYGWIFLLQLCRNCCCTCGFARTMKWTEMEQRCILIQLSQKIWRRIKRVWLTLFPCSFRRRVTSSAGTLICLFSSKNDSKCLAISSSLSGFSSNSSLLCFLFSDSERGLSKLGLPLFLWLERRPELMRNMKRYAAVVWADDSP